LGLRVSEILGLQWGDFDFENRTVQVQRSVVGGRVDDVKTEYSKDDVPIDPPLAEVLLQWRSVSVLPRDGDWVSANPVTGRPFHQESLQKSQLKCAAKLAKLGDDIGWHTFRSLLARRDGCADEGATGTHASCLDPDDDERL
jgi:integrase